MLESVTRRLELDHSGGFASSPWAAVLGHHPGEAHGYPPAHTHPSAPMPMDLHVPQGFPYYRSVYEYACLAIPPIIKNC